VERNRAKGRYEGWGAYVDLSYAFTEQLDASLGLRYSYDEKNFKLQAFDVDSELGPFFALGFTTDGFLEDTRDWDELSPRVQVRWRPNDDWMVTAASPPATSPAASAASPSSPTCRSARRGSRRPTPFPTRSIPRKWFPTRSAPRASSRKAARTLELIGYYYTYEDLQVTVGGQGGGILVENIGEVDGWGVESTLNVLLSDYVDLYLSRRLGRHRSHRRSGRLRRHRHLRRQFPAGAARSSPTRPSSQGRLPAAWPASGSVGPSCSARPGPAAAWSTIRREQDGYTELALRAGFRAHDGWEGARYVENVTNELYYDLTSAGRYSAGAPLRPQPAAHLRGQDELGVRLGRAAGGKHASRDLADLQRSDREHHFHPFTDFKALGERGTRVIVRGEGVYVWDHQGNKLLDGMSGLWNVNVGYGRRELIDAATRQLETLPFYNSFFQCTTEPTIELAERLAGLTGNRLGHVFFAGSGSEANDTQIRLVRRYWQLMGRPARK
jgi:hypothetical protein